MTKTNNVSFYDEFVAPADFVSEIVAGLTSSPKRLSPKFFYDEAGSELFTQITRLPEYYLTRTEVGLYQQYALEIAEQIGEQATLIEYGSGSSEKIRILLEGLKPAIYAPLDISRDYLKQAAEQLGQEYPELKINATCVDITSEFDLPFETSGRRVAFFPGSSIGNFERDEAAAFLARIRQLVGDEGCLLLGVDLKKDESVLNAAYNDSAGVTAAFNLNILNHLNREYQASFELGQFAHEASYNESLGCIQMFLVSQQDQQVTLGETVFSFTAGEKIHTENSHKYTITELQEMAAGAGFANVRHWVDENDLFTIAVLSAS